MVCYLQHLYKAFTHSLANEPSFICFLLFYVHFLSKTVAIIANYLGPKLGIGQYIDQLIQPLVQALRQESIDVVILGSPNAVEKTPSLQKLNSLKRPNGTP